jgi:DNA-binding transcriptional ArsR family regulator
VTEPDETGNGGALTVVLSESCRPLRRSLRPLVWVILEEVALDSVVDAGRVVACTSARQISQRLGVDPGTAAAALRVLRDRGLLRATREQGPAGRFGLSVYELAPITGLELVRPGGVPPHTVTPNLVAPDTAATVKVRPRLDSPDTAETTYGVNQHEVRRQPAIVADTTMSPTGSGSPGPGPASRRSRPATATPALAQCPGQEALDFEPGTSA